MPNLSVRLRNSLMCTMPQYPASKTRPLFSLWLSDSPWGWALLQTTQSSGLPNQNSQISYCNLIAFCNKANKIYIFLKTHKNTDHCLKKETWTKQNKKNEDNFKKKSFDVELIFIQSFLLKATALLLWHFGVCFSSLMYVLLNICKRRVSLQPVADVFDSWFQVGIGEANVCFHQASVAIVKSIQPYGVLVSCGALGS